MIEDTIRVEIRTGKEKPCLKRSTKMKPMLVVGLLMAMPLLIFGQAKPAAPKADTASVEQTLLQMERDWTQASLKKDTTMLDKILAEDWVAIGFQGTTTNKTQALAELKSGVSTTQSVELGDMKVRIFGTTAIVTGDNTEKSSYKGKDSSGKYAWTDVFVQRNGRWEAVASQSTKVTH
jgi:ketosteroid isomerase-like protein